MPYFSPGRYTSGVLSILVLICLGLPSFCQSDCLATKRGHGSGVIKSDSRELAPFDILHQRITLDLTLGNLIKGSCDIQAVPRSEGLDDLQLDLAALVVDSVLGPDGLLEFTQTNELLDIALSTVIGTEDTVAISIFYGGDPPTDASGFGGFYTAPSLIYNLGVGFQSVPHSYGRAWFPCLDNFTERSTYEFLIKTAGGKKAWCNGLLLESIQLGGDTIVSHWSISATMPAYLPSVAAANFSVVRDTFPNVSGTETPVELIAAASDTTAMKNSFIHLQDAFDHFEDLFGPYRWERVGYVLTPIGSMEHATSIHYARSLIDGTVQYETTMAHELAHHWFGDLVTCDRAEEMYINEGFAEYLSYLFLEHVHGRPRYLSTVRSNHRVMVHRAHRMDNGWLTLGNMPQSDTYGEHTYNKGADVVHTLRSYLGDAAFSEGLTSFLTTYAFQPVNSVMLRDHLSATTGIDLTDFFADWIEQPGWAAFEIDEQAFSVGEDGWIVSLSIGQKLRGPASLYHNVPVTIAIIGTDPNNVFRDTLLLGGASTDLGFTVPFEPGFVWLNDDDRISLATTGVTDTISTGTIASDLANFEINSTANDPVVVRMEQYWVATDEGTYEEPFAYVISPDRYWRITGNWTDASRFTGRVTFDGRNTIGSTDDGLMHDTLGVAFREDSLVMLYRPGPGSPWVKWATDVSSFGNATDGFGSMELDSLLMGEYALAWRTSPVGSEEATGDTNHWSIQPNPAKDHAMVLVDHDGLRGSLLVLDSTGRAALSVPVTGRSTRISTESLAQGSYNLFFDRSGKARTFITTLIVQ